jgi:uncharacterized protein (TIGR03435 family)
MRAVLPLGTLLLSVFISAGSAQSPAGSAPQTPAPLTAFDVVSIKPTIDGIIRGDGAARIGWDPGGRYRIVDGSVGVLLRGAYPGIVEIVGLTGWATTEHYDVDAKASREPTATERAELIRQLLADRFKLMARLEQQERPTYALKVARADGALGRNLRRAPIDCDRFQKLSPDERAAVPPSPNEAPRCATMVSSSRIVSGGMTMSRLAGNLRGDAGRVVLDQTGLAGDYELTLEHGGDVSIFTALREQLGLTLEPGRAPLPVLVVERIERPTPD